MPLCYVWEGGCKVTRKKPPALLCMWDSRLHFHGACLRPHSCCLETPGGFITWNLACPRPQDSPWEAMQRKLACPVLCIQILWIIPIREVGVSCKGPDRTPCPHSQGKRKGSVETGLLGRVKMDTGCRNRHGDVSLACFSSRHLPFQEAGSQVTAAPKGAGTVGLSWGHGRG